MPQAPKKWKWKTLESIGDLNPGDLVRGKSGKVVAVVTANYGHRATAVRSYDITNAPEWETMVPDEEEESGG